MEKDIKSYIKEKIVCVNGKKKLNLSVLDELVSDEDNYAQILDAFYDVVNEEGAEVVENYSNLLEDYDLSNIDNDIKYYLNLISIYPLLTPEEEIDLFTRYNNGEVDLKNKLILSNLRWVVSIAKHYSGFGVDFLDLIQDGTLGLIKAVDEFDVTKGYKFSTYSYHWIRQSIQRGISTKSGIIRLPESIRREISKLKKVQEKFMREKGREATISELVDILEYPKEKVICLLSSSIGSISLDVPVGEDEDITIGDLLPDSYNAYSNFEDMDFSDYLRKIIDKQYLTSDITNYDKDTNARVFIKGTESLAEEHRKALLDLCKEYQKVLNLRIKYCYMKKDIFKNTKMMKPIIKEITKDVDDPIEKLVYKRIANSCIIDEKDRNEVKWLDKYLSKHEEEYSKYLERLKELDKERDILIEEIVNGEEASRINDKVNEIVLFDEIRKIYEANITYIRRCAVLHLICSKHSRNDSERIVEFIEKRFRVDPPEIYSIENCEKKQYDYTNSFVEAFQKYNLVSNNELTKFVNDYKNIKNIVLTKSCDDSFLDNCARYQDQMKNLRIRDILYKRLGLGVQTNTLIELGDEYNITRERIRQIETKEIRVLRKKIDIPSFKKVLDNKMDLKD